MEVVSSKTVTMMGGVVTVLQSYHHLNFNLQDSRQGVILKQGSYFIDSNRRYSMISHVKDYYRAVCEAQHLGNIESNFAKPIMTLLEQFGCKARDLSGARSGQAGENVDIKLWRGDEDIAEIEPFAGVEIKKVGGIDARAKTQIKKSATLYGYAILTDNLVWEFWRGGEDKMYSGVRLIELVDGRLELRQDSVELFVSLMQDFLLQDPTQIRSSNKLAEYMAIHARTIRTVITGILKEDGEGLPLVDERQRSLPMFLELYGLYSKIKQELRPFLNTRSFADMYAQTIVYGLFIARYNDAGTKTFNRFEAIGKLQEESALLNSFFTHIASAGKKHPTLDVVIDKLCSLYQTCDISILLDNDKRGDAIIHFYEDFLAYYDPALRKSLGVFYTPYQVVQYLVSMVDKSLVEDFGIAGGLSNNDHFEMEVASEEYVERKRTRHTKKISVPKVAILDPAAGTGTFHVEAIKYIKNTYFSGARSAFYDEYIRNENGLLSRMIGFEIMMTSYVVAHLNIRRTIKETLNHTPNGQISTNIFLPNTLAPPNTDLERNEQISLFDFSAAIADEAYNADTWKTRRPIKVIMGNPPYLAASATPYDIEAYKLETDGTTKLKEKNAKWLNDDYVKFFRFSEQIINRNGKGILAFVSNNGYLDNPTFRGMRASLLRTFDKIYIVDLHGSANKQEKAPDGGKDENIFDIKQGASLFVGMKTTTSDEWAKVYHADLWGGRKQKFDYLQKAGVQYSELQLDPKMVYFIPYWNDDKETYAKGVSLADLFPANVVGIVTARDALCIQDDRADIESVLREFQMKDAETLRHQYNLGKDTRDWSVEGAKRDIEALDGKITQIAFRPFDNRYTYYTGRSKGFHCMPRGGVMRHMLTDPTSPVGANIGMVFGKTSRSFFPPFISTNIIASRLFSALCEIAYVAPLYLRTEAAGIEKWEANLDNEAFKRLTQYLPSPPTPIEIFDYAYGVLHDPVYIERFGDFLCRDFPRIPIINAPPEGERDFIVSEEMFATYSTAGTLLRKLHLLQEKTPAELTLEPNTPTDLEIETPKYKNGILNINKNKQIHGIPADVWAYRIGGYQVLDKWFKSHKGKTMTIDDFDHISNVVGLIAETMKIQRDLQQMHVTKK